MFYCNQILTISYLAKPGMTQYYEANVDDYSRNKTNCSTIILKCTALSSPIDSNMFVFIRQTKINKISFAYLYNAIGFIETNLRKA